MKTLRLILLFAICGLSCHNTQAQEVFNMVLQSATRMVNNPTSNYQATRVAQFKRTALTYMREKAFEQSDSVKIKFLDTQAYYLSEFTSMFFHSILRYQGYDRRERIYLFMQASRECPMWNDPDKETAESYILADEITPFSLDTDWEVAYAKAQILMKKYHPEDYQTYTEDSAASQKATKKSRRSKK